MLSREEVGLLHEDAIREHGGSLGVLNEDRILSAIEQPLQSFGGVDLYEGIIAKCAALGYFLTKAHGFQDGNKRIGFMAMVVALLQEGYHLKCHPDDGEFIILSVAEGEANLEALTTWVEKHIQPTKENAVAGVYAGMRGLLQSASGMKVVNDALWNNVENHNGSMNRLLGTRPTSNAKHQKQIKDLLDITAKSFNFTATRLRFEIENAKESAALLERNAPYISDWMDLSTPESRQMANGIGRILATYDVIESRFISYRSNVEEARIYAHHAGISVASQNLVSAYDDLSTFFGVQWFAWKDMLDGLQVALKQEGTKANE